MKNYTKKTFRKKSFIKRKKMKKNGNRKSKRKNRSRKMKGGTNHAEHQSLIDKIDFSNVSAFNTSMTTIIGDNLKSNDIFMKILYEKIDQEITKEKNAIDSNSQENLSNFKIKWWNIKRIFWKDHVSDSLKNDFNFMLEAMKNIKFFMAAAYVSTELKENTQFRNEVAKIKGNSSKRGELGELILGRDDWILGQNGKLVDLDLDLDLDDD